MEPTSNYRLFGLTISSALALTACAPPSTGPPDAWIVYGEVTSALDHPSVRGVRFESSSTRLLLRVDGVARFLVEAGCRIVIDRAVSASDDEVRLFLLGPVMAGLLRQRNCVVLRGSAIDWEGSAMMILGKSGAGCSTLAAALALSGRRSLADGLCAISRGPNHSIQLLPGPSSSKLWLDSLAQLGLESAPLPRARPQLELRLLALSVTHEPLPLRRFCVLDSWKSDDVAAARLSGPERFAALSAHVYQPRQISNVENAQLFPLMMEVARQTTGVHLHRPLRRFTLPELLARIPESFEP